jgi:ribonuclease D
VSKLQAKIITDQVDLEALCRALRARGRFAFDTEFIRDDTYDAILCLIQINSGDHVSLIDPTNGLDVAPFWDLVTDEQVETIVHAGKEDFEVCLRQSGKPPRNIFDVQIAAGFVGYGYPLSLSRLVDAVLSQRIDKGATLTDWLRRPLTEKQVQYAIEDVAHLPAIHAKLSDQLRQRGRGAWTQEEFLRFAQPDFYKPPVQDRLYRIKGATRLDALGLAVLERLLVWRDAWARERNRPIRALMRDDVLLEIARRRPKKEADVSVLRGFHQARNTRLVRELLDLIEDVRSAPREHWPRPIELREETPMMKATLDLLSAVLRAYCFEEDVSTDLVGSAQRLRELIDYSSAPSDEPPALLRGWRAEFIGQKLLDLLAGRSEIHLSGWPAAPRLTIETHS